MSQTFEQCDVTRPSQASDDVLPKQQFWLTAQAGDSQLCGTKLLVTPEDTTVTRTVTAASPGGGQREYFEKLISEKYVGWPLKLKR